MPRQWRGCQCKRFLTCAHACDCAWPPSECKQVCTGNGLWEESPLLHWGLEPSIAPGISVALSTNRATPHPTIWETTSDLRSVSGRVFHWFIIANPMLSQNCLTFTLFVDTKKDDGGWGWGGGWQMVSFFIVSGGNYAVKVLGDTSSFWRWVVVFACQCCSSWSSNPCTYPRLGAVFWASSL